MPLRSIVQILRGHCNYMLVNMIASEGSTLVRLLLGIKVLKALLQRREERPVSWSELGLDAVLQKLLTVQRNVMVLL